MLCPTERITNRRRLVGTRGGDERIRDLVKQGGRDPANFLHHFGRVASEVASQCLKYATRMLQGQIALGETEVRVTFVGPGLFVVSSFLFVPTGEKASRAFVCITKIFAQNAGGIRVVRDVIAEEEIILDNVSNDSSEKGDVSAG